jgi:hypothetical protein
MGFLRRLLGGGDDSPPPDETSVSGADLETDERARDLDLARAFDAGLTDLQRDQLRYAGYAWQPPDQHRGDPADRETPDPEGDEGPAD